VSAANNASEGTVSDKEALGFYNLATDTLLSALEVIMFSCDGKKSKQTSNFKWDF
jgi:hypothetical protein